VIQYKLFNDSIEYGNDSSSTAVVKKWVYVGYSRAHTHDVRALTVAVPIDSKAKKRDCHRLDSYNFSYRKWANLRIPILICSTMSYSGMLFAYPIMRNHTFLNIQKREKNASTLAKKKLPRKVPFAHSMVFSADSSKLIIAGHDRKIYKLLHTFTPCRDANDDLSPSEPPVTRMFASSDGQWLSAVNCFGDIYHWFVSLLELVASVTAGGFTMTQEYGIVLIITTSTNQVYVFDVEEFPGEIIGMSFPQSCSTAVIIYSTFMSSHMMMTTAWQMGYWIHHQRSVSNGNGKVNHKRKRDSQNNLSFNFSPFKHPALFVGHLSDSSVLVIEKPWREVVQSFLLLLPDRMILHFVLDL
ncbi:hypothetical protein MKX01_028480, partial [Papaver californicum]